MSVRKLNPQDINVVSTICIEAFNGSVAPTLTDEGAATFNLDSAVESQKSTQSIGAPDKPEKKLITGKVTTLFSDSPCTPMICASFPRLTAESRFKGIASPEGFSQRMKADNDMLVFDEDGEVKGIIELKAGRHIAMFFISPEFQKQGIGKKLLSAALSYARFEVVTVSASLPSVPAYLNYGFVCSGEVAELSGLIYQPMELDLLDGNA